MATDQTGRYASQANTLANLHIPHQEPLALKKLRDAMEEEGFTHSHSRKVLCYYTTLTELVAMNGQGCRVWKKHMEERAFVDGDDHVEIRRLLTSLRLVRFEERRVAGGGARKAVYCFVLRAPYAGYEPRVTESGLGTREEAPTEEPLRWLDTPAGSKTRPLKDIEDIDSVVPTNVVTTSSPCSSISQSKHRNDDNRIPTPNTSLKDWTRADIVAWHREHPTDPPDGCTWQQAMLQATATIPGYPALEANVKGGLNALAKRLTALATRPFRGSTVPYKNWMDALLSFSSIPAPAGEATTLNYFIGALGNTAVNSIGRDHEAEHQRLMAGGLPKGLRSDQVVTDQELNDIMAGVYG